MVPKNITIIHIVVLMKPNSKYPELLDIELETNLEIS